jgi:hypothetical protein
LLAEPKDDGATCEESATLPLLNLVLIELGRHITRCTLSPEALETFNEFSSEVDKNIHQYGLTLEYLVGILGKTNGKVVRFSAANALLDLGMFFLTEFNEEMTDLFNSCHGQSVTKYCPDGAIEVISKNVQLMPSSILVVNPDHVKSAIGFVTVAHSAWLL